MKKITLILLFLLLSVLLYGNNDQWDNDFYLKNLSVCGRSLTDNPQAVCSVGDYKFDDDSKKMFNQLMTEYGIATSLGFNEPAETLGRKGFETSFVYSMYSVGNSTIKTSKGVERNPWEGTFGRDSKKLHIVNLRVRKGLPASFEVGGNVSYVLGSHMFMMGVSGKFALLEGINILPDVAIRATYNQLFGSRQVIMNNKSVDLIISYDFGIAGMFALAPYFAFSKTYIGARSNLIQNNTAEAPYTCQEDGYCNYQNDGNYDNNLDSFGSFETSVNRYVFGVRINNAAFILIPEIILTSEDPWGVNIKVGVDF